MTETKSIRETFESCLERNRGELTAVPVSEGIVYSPERKEWIFVRNYHNKLSFLNNLSVPDKFSVPVSEDFLQEHEHNVTMRARNVPGWASQYQGRIESKKGIGWYIDGQFFVADYGRQFDAQEGKLARWLFQSEEGKLIRNAVDIQIILPYEIRKDGNINYVVSSESERLMFRCVPELHDLDLLGSYETIDILVAPRCFFGDDLCCLPRWMTGEK